MLEKAKKLAQAGQFAQAEAIYQKLLSAKRVQGATLHAAITFHNRYTHQFRKALPLLQTLLKQNPNDARGHALAAETLSHINECKAALTHAAKAVDLSPDDGDIRFAATLAALKANDFDLATQHVDHALALDPTHRAARIQKGWTLLGLGDTDAAAALCRDLFAEKPEDINVLGLYMDASKIKADDPILAYMRDDLLPRYKAIGGATLAHLLKLIGKGHNDCGQYDAAITAYTQAKAAAPMAYDAKGYTTYTKTLCQNITRADYFGKGSNDDRPVLIVGMPRSGSTLLEQILVSHPQIGGVGESPALHQIVQKVGVKRHNGVAMVSAVKQMPVKASKTLAQNYLDSLGGGDATRVIDKSLHNFELLGFFAAILPKARIIHMVRDPMDTCVSCYMQTMSGWHKYTQSLDTLGHAYVQYQVLMDHWKTVLPNPMIDVNYEALVDDVEDQARRVIAFLGLDWDPACLEYQQRGQQTRTLSARQVRQPIYKTAMQRWRRYDVHLDPLKRHLVRYYPDGLNK